MIQLTEKEALAYKDCPTLLDLSTGFYIFPVCVLSWPTRHTYETTPTQPTKGHVVKIAIHKFGYTHSVNIEGHDTEISTPRTVVTDPVRGLAIPKRELQLLRTYLREIYPDLADKPFMGTRLCWRVIRSNYSFPCQKEILTTVPIRPVTFRDFLIQVQ